MNLVPHPFRRHTCPSFVTMLAFAASTRPPATRQACTHGVLLVRRPTTSCRPPAECSLLVIQVGEVKLVLLDDHSILPVPRLARSQLGQIAIDARRLLAALAQALDPGLQVAFLQRASHGDKDSLLGAQRHHCRVAVPSHVHVALQRALRAALGPEEREGAALESLRAHLERVDVRVAPGGAAVEDVGQEGHDAQCLGVHLLQLQRGVARVPDTLVDKDLLVHQLPHLCCWRVLLPLAERKGDDSAGVPRGVVVGGAALVGPKVLDGGEAAYAVLATDTLVLVGVAVHGTQLDLVFQLPRRLDPVGLQRLAVAAPGRVKLHQPQVI
mmetsp:Transcript_23512/g.59080  ORF Transcript_23512/g.59080 Transcript_23512/m.59080 type:complete len:326 (+) Transcript_23512:120-1097(+)